MKKIISSLFHVWLFIINYSLKPLLWGMSLLFNVRFKNLGVLYTTRPPYLMLPNHVNQWDPFFLSFAAPTPIRWLASDAAFRGDLKWMLSAFGAIPKVKGQSDMISLQHLKNALEMREVGGIFPEGNQNWDGRTGPLIAATAKLVRFMKVPVIVPVFKGGYLTKPRWAWKKRRCRIEIYFRRIIDSKEIKTLKLSEIERRIEEALRHDEYEWQAEKKVPIRSERRAESLELAHWACPSCKGIGTITSEGNAISCICGYTVEVDVYGFFRYPKAGPSFDHPADWIQWQENLLKTRFNEFLTAAPKSGPTADTAALPAGRKAARGKTPVSKNSGTLISDPILLSDAEVTLMKGERAMPMLPVLHGEARLYRDRIEVRSGRRRRSFPLKEITAVNTFKQQKFEFRYEKAQYRFRFSSRHASGFKWETAFKVLKNLLAERGEW